MQLVYSQVKTESSMACKVVNVRCSTKRKLFSCVCDRSWVCSAVVRDTSSAGQHITMRVSAKVSANITKMVDFYSQFNPSPLSIKQFIDFGKLYTHLFCLHSFLGNLIWWCYSSDVWKYRSQKGLTRLCSMELRAVVFSHLQVVIVLKFPAIVLLNYSILWATVTSFGTQRIPVNHIA